ncbi:Winged helix-like DNA-binding domain superfamily [Sesbania bispinosa]|nr:Winged helix-like DNA-binding domain superfamily [Sesbania bispinosa]
MSAWEKEEEAKEAHAQVDIWKIICGFVEMAAVKCAIELGIPEAIEKHGSPMTLLELSSTLGCDPSYLNRIMRFLVNRKIFKIIPIKHDSLGYAHTPLSRCLMRNGEHSMASLILMETSPIMLAPWHCLSARVLVNGNPSFENVYGEDLWQYTAENLDHSKLFNEAMACDAKFVVPAIIEGCREAFDGVSTLVDVGGGNGTTSRILAKACPRIQLTNFDLPHVIAAAPKCNGVEHVAGDMFQSVPKADAVFIKWILHDWGDKECIQILKKCREAIPKENGRVIIVEAVIEEGEEKRDKFKDIGLLLDMVMMAHTSLGKERTLKEWDYVIKMAGFSAYTLKAINAVQSRRGHPYSGTLRAARPPFFRPIVTEARSGLPSPVQTFTEARRIPRSSVRKRGAALTSSASSFFESRPPFLVVPCPLFSSVLGRPPSLRVLPCLQSWIGVQSWTGARLCLHLGELCLH